ncbi:MAG: type I-E CRISPR-associated endonuclease Cas1 [Candidatus Helarchaeota archaeon]|nr:type I-E CRISPR-associated endonuclease Cas1 [Candidatus Helarchaeota archaeon]
MKKDLHEIPKIKDSLSYLYIEHAKIRQDGHSIAFYDKEGVTPVPCASLNLLMLGPGTDITHAAVRNLVENDCMILWCGEEGVRFYAQGLGRTRSAKNVIYQAILSSIMTFRVIVAKKMYLKRFDEDIPFETTITQLRGKEGARVREIYRENSERTGVPWNGRVYKRNSWFDTDPINRAISAANSCLYGICHAAIVAMGYSPALGFIHTGKQLSFVYDIADLYKTEITIPLSFDIVKESTKDISRRVRRNCREKFRTSKLLSRIVNDIKDLFDIESFLNPMQRNVLRSIHVEDLDYDSDYALPGFLWDPSDGSQKGGENYDMKE